MDVLGTDWTHRAVEKQDFEMALQPGVRNVPQRNLDAVIHRNKARSPVLASCGMGRAQLSKPARIYLELSFPTAHAPKQMRCESYWLAPHSH